MPELEGISSDLTEKELYCSMPELEGISSDKTELFEEPISMPDEERGIVSDHEEEYRYHHHDWDI